MKSLKSLFNLTIAFFISIALMINDRLFAYMVGAGMIAQAIPTLAQVKQYSTTGNGLEGIRQSLYDNMLYPTAGIGQLAFFTQPQGQGLTSALGGNVGAVKSYADTDMDVAGMLPSGKAFAATSVEITFYPGASAAANTYTARPIGKYLAQAAESMLTDADDVNSFYQSGWLEFYINSKVVLREAPLMRFPPKCALHLEASASQAGTNATNAGLVLQSSKAAGRPYMLEPLIYIEPSVNFNVTLNFPGVVATPSGFNARAGIILDGYLYRTA